MLLKHNKSKGMKGLLNNYKAVEFFGSEPSWAFLFNKFSELRLKFAKKQQHPFHVLTLSKLPFFAAMLAGCLVILITIKIQNVTDAGKFLFIGNMLIQPFYNADPLLTDYSDQVIDSKLLVCIILVLVLLWSWGRELINEATFKGFHSINVQTGLMYGMMLFLASEAMLFFPFFWSFFHASLSPSIVTGSDWPPEGIEALDPFMLPLVNTAVLLASGVALVAAHRAIIKGKRSVVLEGLFVAISLGILFSWLQYLEYGLTKYTIIDGIFGSTFFILTGLHGFHVIVGTCLLILAYWRTAQNHFTTFHHIFFELAAWYWHFVDVVWLFVFAFIYCWGADLGLGGTL